MRSKIHVSVLFVFLLLVTLYFSPKIAPAIILAVTVHELGHLLAAKLCGISETYFRTLFKKVVGVSPLKYINDRKISRAKELISSKMYSIREVAQLAGFHDEAYFSREFKKATGVCPSKYFAV